MLLASFSALASVAPPPPPGMSGRAALFVHHAVDGPSASSSSPPAWAAAASRAAGRLDGVLPAVLVANRPPAATLPNFARVVRLDVVSVHNLTLPTRRALCGVKIFALLEGWERGFLPPRVLLLDLDAFVLRPRALLALFAPLSNNYDMVGVMEGYSHGWEDGGGGDRDGSPLPTPPDPAGRGWELNTGVVAVRREAVWLVRKWADEFKSRTKLYSMLTGVDQSALMLVLAREPRARVFPMPPSFNLRTPTLYAAELGTPVVVHSRVAMRAQPALRAAISKIADSARETITSQQEQPHRQPSSWRARSARRRSAAAAGRQASPPPRNCRRLPGGCGGIAALQLAGHGGDAAQGPGPKAALRSSFSASASTATSIANTTPAVAATTIDILSKSTERLVVNGPTGAARHALSNLTRAWCMERPGCMASWWRPLDLGQQRRRILSGVGRGGLRLNAKSRLRLKTGRPAVCFLAGGRPHSESGITPDCSCFAPDESTGRHAAPCPPIGTTPSVAPVFEGEFGFELLHALPFLHWLRACGLLGHTHACSGMRPFYSFNHGRPFRATSQDLGWQQRPRCQRPSRAALPFTPAVPLHRTQALRRPLQRAAPPLPLARRYAAQGHCRWMELDGQGQRAVLCLPKSPVVAATAAPHLRRAASAATRLAARRWGRWCGVSSATRLCRQQAIPRGQRQGRELLRRGDCRSDARCTPGVRHAGGVQPPKL